MSESPAAGEHELLTDDPVQPVIASSEIAYPGMVWSIRKESFEFGDIALTREFVDHTGAVAVLAMDDQERILLIKQYRHPIRAREWELPAGLLDITGEDPLTGAQRELAEEADLVAGQWDLLTDFQTSPGGSNEAIRVYLARGLSDSPEVFARFDEEAEIEKRWVSIDEAVDAVLASRLQNSILAISVLAADAARRRGWTTLSAASTPWTRHPLYTAPAAAAEH